MPLRELPCELVSAILEHLVPTSTFPKPADYTALRHCSLVDLTWRDCAQPLLVRRTALIGGTRLAQLEYTLRGRVDLRLHVNELLMVMERVGTGRPIAELTVFPLPSLKRLTLGGWVDLEGFSEAEAPSMNNFSLLAHSSLTYRTRTLWAHLTSLSLGAPCPSTAGTIWPAPTASFSLPHFGSALTSLAIISPLPLSTSTAYLETFPPAMLSNLTFLSLEFSPRWAPSGSQPRQLSLWKTVLLPLCTSLKTIRLSLITIMPWLSIVLRACPTQVQELQLVLHPEEEQVVDLGMYLSRTLEGEIGRLEELKILRVVDKEGGMVLKGVVSDGLRQLLNGRGCQVVEGGLTDLDTV